MDGNPKSFHNTALLTASAQLTLTIHRIACGTFTGHWEGHLPYNRLIYIFEGSRKPSSIRDDTDVFDFRPGHWLLVPAGHTIVHDQHDGLRLISIHFGLERLPGIDYLSGCPGLRMGAAPERRQDFEALFNRQAGLADAVLLRTLLWEFLLPVIRAEEAGLVRHAERVDRFQPLVAAFASDPRRDFSVEEMAAVMGMGKVSFIKQFTAQMGQAPKEFFLRMRAGAAAQELLATDDTIREIAARFNFSDEFYFSRFMKRMTGLSPRGYRKRLRGR